MCLSNVMMNDVTFLPSKLGAKRTKTREKSFQSKTPMLHQSSVTEFREVTFPRFSEDPKQTAGTPEAQAPAAPPPGLNERRVARRPHALSARAHGAARGGQRLLSGSESCDRPQQDSASHVTQPQDALQAFGHSALGHQALPWGRGTP